MGFKGQSALDFLMTYGWALLLIVLAVGALFALGVFNMGSFVGARAVGFTQVGVSAWRLNPTGNLTLQLANRAGTDISVTNITTTYQTQTIVANYSLSLSNGVTSNVTAPINFTGTFTAGTTYSIPVVITYTDKLTNFVYQTTGTLTGVVG
jgi:hypothetical protein